MLLKINGESVEFTLEKESVLSEVVKGVQDWLGGSGFLITGIRMGEQDLFSLPRPQWEGTPISSIPELDFRVRHAGEVRLEHWVTARAWLGALAKEVASPGGSLEELAVNLPSTLESLKKNPFMPSGSDAIDRLASLFIGQTPDQVRAWPAERGRETARVIEEIRGQLGKRIDEATHPRESLKSYIAELRLLHGRISDVSVLLQTGKDRQAMETVVGFSELVQKLLDIVPYLPKDAEREKLFAELNPVLREIISAFDARDFVLIGDLFEYEVAPRIGKLLPLLEKCA